MDTLCDDCQFLIIKLLDLCDQLALFEATKTEATNRWRENLRHTWKRQKIYYLHEYTADVINRSPELSREFLSIISPTVSHLELLYVQPKYLECWTSYKFPKMKSLIYVQDNDGIFFGDVHSILQILSECAQNVEELEIYDSDIREGEVQLLLCFPKLRTLLLGRMDDSYFVHGFMEMRAKDITKLNYNIPFWIDVKAISKLINLRQLTLRYCIMLEPAIIKCAIAVLPSLERLDFGLYTDIREFEPILLKVVAKYPTLKILNFCKFPLGKEFYVRIKRDLEIALKTRSSPLSLYFDGIDKDIDEREIHSYFKHTHLQISFEPLEIDVNDGIVKLYFDPINNE